MTTNSSIKHRAELRKTGTGTVFLSDLANFLLDFLPIFCRISNFVYLTAVYLTHTLMRWMIYHSSWRYMIKEVMINAHFKFLLEWGQKIRIYDSSKSIWPLLNTHRILFLRFKQQKSLQHFFIQLTSVIWPLSDWILKIQFLQILYI